MINFALIAASIEDEKTRRDAEQIFHKYENAIYWTAYEILQSHTDTEDTLMETAVRLCRNIDMLADAPEDTFETLYRGQIVAVFISLFAGLNVPKNKTGGESDIMEERRDNTMKKVIAKVLCLALLVVCMIQTVSAAIVEPVEPLWDNVSNAIV